MEVAFGMTISAGDVPLPCTRGFAIVTPDNPFSCPTTVEENIARRTAFRRTVSAAGRLSALSEGHDPTGVWPVEHGLAVIDASDAELDRWMIQFGQNAVLEVPSNVPARLRLHPHAR